MMPVNNSKASVFDVSKPNKTAPSPTSRPVIATHNPMMKDRMVIDNPESTVKDEEKPVVVSREKVVEPISESPPSVEEVTVLAAAEAESKEADRIKSEAAVVDAVAEQSGRKKKSEPTKEDIVRQAEIEKMIEAKKYFAPIGQVNHRRNKRWFWVSLTLLLLSAAAVYAAIDANILDVGIKLPYEFIP